MTAGNLGVFFAKVRGEHQECVKARTVVYVIEGNIVEEGDAALTGNAFAINPNPTG